MLGCECNRCGECAEAWAIRAGVLPDRKVPSFVAAFCDARAAIAAESRRAADAGTPWPGVLDLHLDDLPPSSACAATYDMRLTCNTREIDWEDAIEGPSYLLRCAAAAAGAIGADIVQHQLNGVKLEIMKV